jgi:hypothetical protein
MVSKSRPLNHTSCGEETTSLFGEMEGDGGLTIRIPTCGLCDFPSQVPT